MAMDVEGFRLWLDNYFSAWASNDSTDVSSLFTEDARYAVGPFAEPWVGREEIVARWTSGPQEEVVAGYDVLGVVGDVGTAHWNVRSTDPANGQRSEMDGILVLTFAPDGRCRDHREWLDRREIPGA